MLYELTISESSDSLNRPIGALINNVRPNPPNPHTLQHLPILSAGECICCQACESRVKTTSKYWRGSLCGLPGDHALVIADGVTKINLLISSKKHFDEVAFEEKCPKCRDHTPETWC